MGRIPEDDVARVRDATDITALISESVVLQKKGRLLWGLCPFHGEKTPSFKVDPATQLWHCFGCGEGGDAFGFVMRREHLEFPEAVRLLADRARIEIREEAGGAPSGQRERLQQACEAAADLYHQALTRSREPEAVQAREYLAKRGFGIEVARSFTLGYAARSTTLASHLRAEGFSVEEIIEANLALPPFEGGAGAKSVLRDRFFGRIMFPIRDLNGRVIAFGGRILGRGEPKYLNSRETLIFSKSSSLYGIEKAKGSIVATGTAIVVEGYTDVIALHQAGLTNTVATLGTALTRRHLRLLGRFARKVIYLFDGDAAGLKAAERAADFVDASATPETGRQQVELFVTLIPEGLDPADYVARHGAEGMSALLEGGQPLLQFAIDRRLDAYDLSTPGGRAAALAKAAAVIAPVRGSIIAHDYTNYLADRLLVDFETVRAAIDSARFTVVRGDDENTRAQGGGVAASGVRERIEEPEVLDAYTRAQRALAGLVAAEPSLRTGARSLLETDLFIDPVAHTLLETTTDAGNAVDDDLYRHVAEVNTDAAAVLTGLLMDVPPAEEIHSVARQTLAKVKELALERLIKQERARQRALEAAGDTIAADILFKEIAALMAEQARLRQGAVPIEAGVWDH
ncbi:MAG: DNA primase [Coriobacteriia bacterium]|nr:DNA primase [Coriobacteriia bacterium]